MRVSISNFKSIACLDFELNNINIFIGPPNTGKSNILEAIHLYGIWKRAKIIFEKEKNYDYLSFEKPFIRGLDDDVKSIFRDWDSKNTVSIVIDKPLEISLEIREPLKSEYELLFNNKNLKEFVESEDSPPILTLLYTYEYFVKYPTLFTPRIVDGINFLLPNFQNLDNCLTTIYPEVFEILRKYTERFEKDFGLDTIFGNKRVIFVDRFIRREIPLHSIAQSILYFILFSSAILISESYIKENKENVVVLLEEPDAHMFPIVIEEFVEVLNNEVKKSHIVITTHNESTVLKIIDNIPQDKLKVFGILRDEKGYTAVNEIDIEKLRNTYIDLGGFIRNLKYIIDEVKKQ